MKNSKKDSKQMLFEMMHKVCGMPLNENQEEEYQPEEDDCFVESDGFKLSVSCGNKFIGKYVEDDDAWNAVKEWKKKNNYFPNTWFVSDHGNISIVDDDGNELKENQENNDNKNKLIIYLNYKRGLIQFTDDEGDVNDEFEFEPLSDGTIDTDFNDIKNSLSHIFKGETQINNNLVTIKIISYKGEEIQNLEIEDNVPTFKDLINYIEDANREFESFDYGNELKENQKFGHS